MSFIMRVRNDIIFRVIKFLWKQKYGKCSSFGGSGNHDMIVNDKCLDSTSLMCLIQGKGGGETFSYLSRPHFDINVSRLAQITLEQ